MRANTKLKIYVKKLAFLTPILCLSLSLSSGVAHANPSVYGADGVLGQSSYTSVGSGTAANQLNYPNSTVIDTAHHRLFVSDFENNRVLVYQLDNNDQIESQTASYAIGAATPNSVGNNSASINTFDEGPYAIAYDPVNNRLFVEDYYRVLVFNLSNGISNSMNASYVLGEPDFTTTNSTTSINTLNEPGPYGGGLAFDPTNDRLFVADAYRVLVFNVSPSSLQTNGNGENASYVIGQTNFTNINEACSRNGLYTASYNDDSFSLAFDNANQRLFVSDGYECSRVLVFDVSPATLQANGNGENASYVLGQTSFTSSTYNATQNNLYGPTGIGYDPSNNTLFVDDYYGIRVMLFNVSPSTIANYENAYAVLGEPDFTTLNTGASQTALYYAYFAAGGFAIDPTDNQLFLPDQYNNRVLTYNFITMTNKSQLSSGTKGQSYSQTLTSEYAQGTVTYSVTSGSLPPGLSLNSSTGVISGTPTTAGTYNFEITAYDAIGTAGTFQDDPSYTITINSAGSTSTPSVTAPNTGYGSPQSNSSTALFVSSAGIIMLGIITTYIHRRRSTN